MMVCEGAGVVQVLRCIVDYSRDCKFEAIVEAMSDSNESVNLAEYLDTGREGGRKK